LCFKYNFLTAFLTLGHAGTTTRKSLAPWQNCHGSGNCAIAFYSAALSRTIQAAMTLQRLVLFKTILVSRNKQALRQMLAMEHFHIACRNVGIT